MIRHGDIGPQHFGTSRKLSVMISSRQITIAGNCKLKIYGQLSCSSGKRMKRENRVFFEDVCDALAHGYRPCGHCMREEYLKWKRRQS